MTDRAGAITITASTNHTEGGAMRWPLSFCPDCGQSLPGPEGRHHQHCPHCGEDHYRNPKPCAGTLIVRDGRLLLARRGIQPYEGMWNLVGGFLEPDEDPAHAAIREAHEETGLDVRLVELVGMYIDRYGDDGHYTLNIYYLAEAPDGEPVPTSDVTELAWFGPADLPLDGIAFDCERAVATQWAAGSHRRGRPPS